MTTPDERDAMVAEVERLRVTNRELNRRCQLAERESREARAAMPQGSTLTKMLMAAKHRDEMQSLAAELAELRAIKAAAIAWAEAEDAEVAWVWTVGDQAYGLAKLENTRAYRGLRRLALAAKEST